MFHPKSDSLKLLSTAEDFVIRVWDLVLKKEVSVLKPRGKDDNMAHMTTSIVFTNDKKTLITGGRDSCLHFWNAEQNFKHISSVTIKSLGSLKFDEINSLVYISSKVDPCIVIGGSSGQILVYSINRQEIIYRANESRILGNNDVVEDGSETTNEIVFLEYLKNSNQIIAINGDQNAFVYEIVAEQGVVLSLKLAESHALYLDEIIDMKFINENKEAILCSNSESIKLFNFESGTCELYPGHSDIIISVDKF